MDKKIICCNCYFKDRTCFPNNEVFWCKYYINNNWIHRNLNCDQCWYLHQCREPYPPEDNCKYYTPVDSTSG